MLDRAIKIAKKPLKAAGIIEVVIAMLIICVVMISSSVLYARLLDGTKGMLCIRAEAAASEIYSNTLRDKSFVSEEGLIHEIQYQKEVTTEPNAEGLYKVCITLFTAKGDTIHQFNALTRIP
jgi:hypothetical protein